MPGLMLCYNWFKSSKFFTYLQGISPILLKQTEPSSTHQFELIMAVASVIPPQELNRFHLFLFKHLNVDLKIELFLLQRIWLCFLLKSTEIYLNLQAVSRVLHS